MSVKGLAAKVRSKSKTDNGAHSQTDHMNQPDQYVDEGTTQRKDLQTRAASDVIQNSEPQTGRAQKTGQSSQQ
jgi:hypothetical protein